jgi:hypothetical protein
LLKFVWLVCYIVIRACSYIHEQFHRALNLSTAYAQVQQWIPKVTLRRGVATKLVLHRYAGIATFLLYTVVAIGLVSWTDLYWLMLSLQSESLASTIPFKQAWIEHGSYPKSELGWYTLSKVEGSVWWSIIYGILWQNAYPTQPPRRL